MFWPFHRLYTVRGRRRLKPSDKFHPPANLIENNSYSERRMEKIKPARFVPPLSNRIDNGFERDTEILKLSSKDITPIDQIYFMGVIDILQQFNSRKRVEAKFRRLAAGSKDGPSCVHPQQYADRFLRFYDEYTRLEEYETVRENNLT